jgi:hypothetical protein
LLLCATAFSSSYQAVLFAGCVYVDRIASLISRPRALVPPREGRQWTDDCVNLFDAIRF